MSIYYPRRKCKNRLRSQNTGYSRNLKSWGDSAPLEFVRRTPTLTAHQRRVTWRQEQLAEAQPPVRWGFVFKGFSLILLLFCAAFAISLLPSVFKVSRARSMYSLALPASDLTLQMPKSRPHRLFTVSHTLRGNETVSAAIGKLGVTWDPAPGFDEQFDRLFREHNPKADSAKGQLVKLFLDADGSLQELRSRIAADQEIRVAKNAQGKFALNLRKVERVRREKVVLGVIETSLASAAQKAGIPYDIVDDLVDIMSGRISFHKDLHKGDRFTIIYHDKVLADGQSHKAGPILAAVFESGGKEIAAIRYVGTDGKARYFDQEGKALGGGFLRYPARFSKISSPFSQSRFHPLLKFNRPHNGIDFAAPVGTPVRSVGDGEIAIAGWKGQNGIMVKVKHSDRYASAYCHLSSVAKGLRPGTSIARGEVIGYVGSTGLSTGPHLHYMFFVNGRYVDPLGLDLPTMADLKRGLQINSEYLRRVMFTLRHYQAIELKNSYFS